uniref:Uncharacterized protein n=1 Tax=Anguilla anguilla TaxID=7936 RepID=A0A0E9Y0G8_ANGAN
MMDHSQQINYWQKLYFFLWLDNCSRPSSVVLYILGLSNFFPQFHEHSYMDKS